MLVLCHFIIFLSLLLSIKAEEGVSTNATSYTYTQLTTTTVTDSTFTTYISQTAANDSVSATSSTFYYTINNETYTLTEASTLTLTNCPCTFTGQTVISDSYTDTEYASDYWVTVNASSYSTYNSSTATSSESLLTGTFIQLTDTSTSGSLRNVPENALLKTITLMASDNLGLSILIGLLSTAVIFM